MNDNSNIVEEPEKIYDIKHRAYIFSKDTINYIASVKIDRIYFSIFEQLIRSATSIGANLVEGSAGASRKDFINYYTIALKSANETKYWLCLMRDTLNVNKKTTKELLEEADEISKIIAKIIISTKTK